MIAKKKDNWKAYFFPTGKRNSTDVRGQSLKKVQSYPVDYQRVFDSSLCCYNDVRGQSKTEIIPGDKRVVKDFRGYNETDKQFYAIYGLV
ncbi:hypothetical protein CDAR_519701 [Caerostris darwini]|uniref:Uncharacterized protein n=1 Tax=Caerostris darwini TaxID=1538125 RepID=A0AAV4P4F4_9ARAC|nr:hypothetical protein CDAR_519701 [Caerostris darwini]